MSTALEFRGRVPHTLAFGTSGLRGLVSEITDLEASINTRGFLEYLAETGDVARGTAVALCGDLRPSTHSPERSILGAVADAVRRSGFEPIFCGKIPTPALAHFALTHSLPAIAVTGSHIPFDRNGIKFYKTSGEVLKTDEAGILAAVERAREAAYQEPAERSPFRDDGMFKKGPPTLPDIDERARSLYAERYLDAFDPRALSGLRVLVYQHSAVGRDLIAEILSALGAEVHAAGRSESFVALDTEAVSREQLALLQSLHDEAKARHGRIDALISTDGDSDRPLIVGVTKQGKTVFFSGDKVGILTADYLGADAIAVPVSATDAIERHFAPRGIDVVRTRIGSPHVISAMSQLGGRRAVGWEANGGFLCASRLERGGRTLSPLPTRDAVLPILCVLALANERGLSLEELFATLPPRFTDAGLLDAVPEEQLAAVTKRYLPGDPRVARARFRREGVTWFDETEREQTASEQMSADLLEVRRRFAAHFGPARGFSELIQLDFRDGVRATFENGDIAHVRPSGNAPQLRIYAVADSEERATAIVADATSEGGVLWSMLEES